MKIGIILTIFILSACTGLLSYLPNAWTQEANRLPKSQEQIAEDSPFATNDFSIPSRVAKVLGITSTEQLRRIIQTEKIPYFRKLGIKWARLHPNIFATFGWSGVDQDHNGKDLDFSKQDTLVKLAQENNIHLLAGISPTPP